MIESELLTQVVTEGWAINDMGTLSQQGTGDSMLTLKFLYLTKIINSVMRWQKVNYYVKADGTCYWQQHDPFYIETPTVNFAQLVQNKITALVTAATIKAGYIEKVDETAQTALVVVIKSDLSTQIYHAYKSGADVAVSPVTGTYPV